MGCCAEAPQKLAKVNRKHATNIGFFISPPSIADAYRCRKMFQDSKSQAQAKVSANGLGEFSIGVVTDGVFCVQVVQKKPFALTKSYTECEKSKCVCG